jgi:hypothetical protein
MSDEQLPTRAELASAYLDGELEAAQRAAVESDPEAMATVQSFARLRAELNTAEPVDDDVRSAALTAALGEFDARHDGVSDLEATAAGTATSGEAVVTPLKSRRVSRYRVLGGVAAAAVVAIVGIAAINSSNGKDDNTFSAEATTEQTADAPRVKIAVDTASADASGTAAGAGAAAAASIESSTASVPEINSKDELQAFAAGFESVAAAPAPAATTAAATTTAAAAGAIPNVGDSSAQSACVEPGQTTLGQVLYQGTPAVVIRDDATGTVEAINSADCTVLETTP